MNKLIKNIHWVLIVLLVVSLASYATLNFDSISYRDSLFSDTLATIIGIAIGIPVALAIDRTINMREKRERKERILSLLVRELQLNRDSIQNLWTGKEWYERGTYVSLALKDDLWRALSDGGDLQWIDNAELLDKIAYAYYFIGQLRLIAYKLYDGLHAEGTFQFELLTKKLNEYADTLGGMAEGSIESAIAMIEKTQREERLEPSMGVNRSEPIKDIGNN
jgi:hypothetical protein